MVDDIKWNAFQGEIPKMANRLRPQQYAQSSLNADFRTGNLVALGKSGTTLTLSTTLMKTIYKMDSSWLYWPGDIDCVKAAVVPTAEKTLTFYTGDGYPKQTDKDFMNTSGTPDSTADYERLGVIAPTVALTINLHGTGTGEVINSVGYVYTYVCERNGIQHESAPSPPTAVGEGTDVEVGQYVSLTGFVDPVFSSTGNDVDFYRVYRLASGSTGAEYQLLSGRPAAYSAAAVTDIPDGTTTVFDNDDPTTPAALNTPLGEVIATDGFDPPPDDMIGLTEFKNGMLVGFRGKELCVSDSQSQYAWDENNRIRFDQDIVSVGVYGNSLIVATDTFPYIVTGSEPGYLMAEILPYEQGCLNKNGLVSTRMGVIFPTPDGLFLVNDRQGINLTKNLYTKEQWQALDPSTITTAFYDDQIVCFQENEESGFIIDLDGKSVGPFDTLYDFSGYHIISEDDTLHFVGESGGTYYIRSWDDGGVGDLSFTYSTGLVTTGFDTNFPFGRIYGAQNAELPCTFNLYGDGALLYSVSIEDENMFRLPADTRAKDWYVEVVSKAVIESIELISTRGQ